MGRSGEKTEEFDFGTNTFDTEVRPANGNAEWVVRHTILEFGKM